MNNAQVTVADERMMDRPRVSVIVPVYNDAEGLRLCLEALEQQSFPKDGYEVLVVDNDSEVSLQPVVDACAHAHYLSESKRGSYAARNKGLIEARGEILAFTDADCRPDRDWLRLGIERLDPLEDDAKIVGGRIELVVRDPRRPTTPELYDLVFGLSQRTYVEQEHFAATANLFVASRIMAEVGPFDETLQSGGDNAWGKRAHAKGFRLSYAEDVVVRHPTRPSWKEMFTKIRRVTLGNCDLAAKDPAFRRRFWIRLAKVFPSVRYGVGPVLKARKLTPGLKTRLLGAVVLAHYYEYGIRLSRIGVLFQPVQHPS